MRDNYDMGIFGLSQNDSKGVFGRRRRNLMIVCVLMIFLLIANPEITTIRFLGITSDFSNRTWLIWVGLGLWLIYSVMRAKSYYKTYLTEEGFYWNEFVYWKGYGRKRWVDQAKKAERSVEYELTLELNMPIRASLPIDYDTILLSQVRRGNIPG